MIKISGWFASTLSISVQTCKRWKIKRREIPRHDCAAFARDNYQRLKYQQRHFMYIRLVKWGSRYSRTPRHGAARTGPAKNAADHLFVKNKIMFWLLFQERLPVSAARDRDARDKATIKYINNSYRQREYWFTRTCFKCFIVGGINKWGRCIVIVQQYNNDGITLNIQCVPTYINL